jgi:hypothetical protein
MSEPPKCTELYVESSRMCHMVTLLSKVDGISRLVVKIWWARSAR